MGSAEGALRTAASRVGLSPSEYLDRINAGMRWSDRGAARIPWHPDQQRESGAIIGTAFVDEVHYADGDCDPDQCAAWGENAYREHAGRDRTDIVHLLLVDRRPLRDIIPCRGALGLWTVPADIAGQLEAVRR